MTGLTRQPGIGDDASGRPGAPTGNAPQGGVFRDRRFLVAAIVLGLAWAGWSATVSKLKWSMIKEAVPWPASARVSKDFRLASLSDRFGITVVNGKEMPRYVLAADGQFTHDSQGKPLLDGTPDGERIFDKDTMDTLGVGTGYDSNRYPARSSNWYVSRLYIDTSRMDPKGRRQLPLTVWALDVCYYTGNLDKVPHIPERCLQAGGATLVGRSQPVQFKASVGSDWTTLSVNRVRYETKARGTGIPEQFVQYYTFSLNGYNEPSWMSVRWHLAASPWEKYCYFAKIQFGPCDSGISDQEADKAAQDFVTDFLPEVLKALPSAHQVEALNTPPETGKR